MSMSGSARLAGVTGWPVSQSLSPRLHGFWLREHGIDGAYVPLGIRPEDFGRALQGLRLAGFRGLNVTVPHKEAAFAIADRLDEAARAIGAVNILRFDEHGFEGRNTDAYGITASLREAGHDHIKGRPAAIWGAGGTARAAIYALAQLGASEIRLFNRTPARAQGLATAFRSFGRITAQSYDDWTEAGQDVALLIHTTSAGMKETPSINLPLEVMARDAAVLDVVYNPLRTGLLDRAAARGFKTIDGLGMLMHQAVPSFAAFYGVEPKVTPALRAELEKALG